MTKVKSLRSFHMYMHISTSGAYAAILLEEHLNRD